MEEVKDIVIKNVRAAFLSLLKKNEFNNAYDGTFLLSKEDVKQIEIINQAIKKVCIDNNKGIIPSQSFFSDGDTLGLEEYKGFYRIKAKNKLTKPLLCDQKTNKLDEESDLIYSGAWYNIKISPLFYSKPSKGITAILKAVQFVKHDDVLMIGSTPTLDGFEIIDDNEEDVEV